MLKPDYFVYEVNTLVADSIVPWYTRSSARMVLTKHDKQICKKPALVTTSYQSDTKSVQVPSADRILVTTTGPKLYNQTGNRQWPRDSVFKCVYQVEKPLSQYFFVSFKNPVYRWMDRQKDEWINGQNESS